MQVISTSLGNSTDSVEEITLANETVLITNNEIDPPGTRKLDDFKVNIEFGKPTIFALHWRTGLSVW